MLRLPAATLCLLVGVAVACTYDEPTGPTEPANPAMEALPAAPRAVVITRTTVIDQPGNVGSYSSLVSGLDGRQHITYKDAGKQDLRYATCAANCTVARNWSKVSVDTTGAVGHQTSLEVGSNGRRHVSYKDQTNQDLKYATCPPAADCTLATSWQKVPIDTLEDAGGGSSIAIGASGQRHVSHFRRRSGTSAIITGVRYATCSANCGQVGSWSRVTVEENPTSTLWGDGMVTSLAIGPDGRRHISYFHPATTNLKYATCLSGCINPANWQKLTVDANGAVGLHNSLAVGHDGVLHVSYYDHSNGALKYARCALDCTTAASWKTVTVGVGSTSLGLYSSLAVEGNGRVHISTTNATKSSLYYATCNADCTASAKHWQRAELDGADSDVGWHTSLTVRNSIVRISYFDRGKGDLKYLSQTPLANPF
jgi:hypothetical protein